MTMGKAANIDQRYLLLNDKWTAFRPDNVPTIMHKVGSLQVGLGLGG